MPNLTTAIPNKLTGDAKIDISSVQKCLTSLIDELSYILNNLDSGNVLEASKVKAENIDTQNAKISNAQIGALSAEKLKAGYIDTNNVSVKSSNGNLNISGDSLSISDENNLRFQAKYNAISDRFDFAIYNKNGEPTVYINSLGNAVFSGRIDGSEIFSSTVIGTDSAAYYDTAGGVFALMDTSGIKVMQDKNGNRYQKIGMSVSNDGTAYMALGAGDGTGSTIVNGVVYSRGSFLVEKNSSYANLSIVGTNAVVTFLESGDLRLSGRKVLINGTNVLSEISNLESEIANLKSRVTNLENRQNQIII